MEELHDARGHLAAPNEFLHWKRKSAFFLSGQMVSLFGSSITQFAIVWHVTLSTSSGIMLMVSSLCSFLPQILISLFAGVWADRHNRKRLIIMADGMIAFTTLILAIVFISGYKEMWVLFAVSAVRSVGAGIQSPAVSAMIPQIVPYEKLMKMNGINGTIQSLTMMVAPAVSGGVLAAFGLEAAFLIDVFTAIIGIGLLLPIKVKNPMRTKEQLALGALDDLKSGIKYVWNHKFLRVFTLFYAAMMFLATPAAILTPLLTTRSFGEEVWRLTANEMVWSVGSVAGGILISIWGGFKSRIRTLLLGTVLFGFFTMAMGFATNFTIYLILLFVTGVSMPMINSPGIVLLQESAEQNMQGRVFGLVQIVASSCIPLGMAVFGPVADFVKIEYLLIGTGLFTVFLGVIAYFNKTLQLNPKDITNQTKE